MSTIAGQLVTGTRTGTGAIGPFQPPGGLRPFNVFITGTFVGTAEVQKSFDQGATYTTIQPPDLSAIAAFTAPTAFTVIEPDPAVLYQINVTAYTSGTINGRMG
jgi:hypothetical protein